MRLKHLHFVLHIVLHNVCFLYFLLLETSKSILFSYFLAEQSEKHLMVGGKSDAKITGVNMNFGLGDLIFGCWVKETLDPRDPEKCISKHALWEGH